MTSTAEETEEVAEEETADAVEEETAEEVAEQAFPDDMIIEFDDKYLASAIRTKLDISGDITYADLQELTFLCISSSCISSLKGLEYCTNLSKLFLYGNSISDLTPLSSLSSLTTLDIRYNNIKDLSPLFGLTNLKKLYIDKVTFSYNRNSISNLDCEIYYSLY